MSEIIDLRSDTVTRPTPGMREAMMSAPLGDDVLGDEPSVMALEAKFAAHLGKAAACFMPTGTMANQTAIRALTEHGDEILCHEDSHIVQYETGGPAALSGCMVRFLRGPRGQFEAEDVAGAVRPNNVHGPVSKLVVVENTQNRGGGSVWPLERVLEVTRVARERGLKLHLDGARLWNAAVATGTALAEYGAVADSLCVCLSKGLGAPAGSVVVGDAAFVAKAREARKLLGGGMRQVGVLAAPGLVALRTHRARLVDDHRRARRLAEGCLAAPGVTAPTGPPDTNIVIVRIDGVDAKALCDAIARRGVLALPAGPDRVRFVTHYDVDDDDVAAAVGAFGEAVAEVRRG